jgi:hypothetical protein
MKGSTVGRSMIDRVIACSITGLAPIIIAQFSEAENTLCRVLSVSAMAISLTVSGFADVGRPFHGDRGFMGPVRRL